jgi:hypothetical protein
VAQWFAPWVVEQEGSSIRQGIQTTKASTCQHGRTAMVIAERGRLGFNSKFLIETGEEMEPGPAAALRGKQ